MSVHHDQWACTFVKHCLQMNLQAATQARTKAIDTTRKKLPSTVGYLNQPHQGGGVQILGRDNIKCMWYSKLMITMDRFLSLQKLEIPLCGNYLPTGLEYGENLSQK